MDFRFNFSTEEKFISQKNGDNGIDFPCLVLQYVCVAFMRLRVCVRVFFSWKGVVISDSVLEPEAQEEKSKYKIAQSRNENINISENQISMKLDIYLFRVCEHSLIQLFTTVVGHVHVNITYLWLLMVIFQLRTYRSSSPDSTLSTSKRSLVT